MYHNSSTSYMNVLNNHSLPSPEYTGDSDSDSDIIHELEHRRRQLDEEIARFQAQKDKEFRDFEAEVKEKRRQKRGHQQPQTNNGSNYYEFTKNSPSATPPVSSMLIGCEKKTRGPSRHNRNRSSEPIRLMKPSAGSKVTPPTICLDKMTISGESVIQSHVSPLQTPPTPTMAVGMEDHASLGSVGSTSTISESPRHKSSTSPKPKTHQDSGAFSGLFTSSFLPLLDVRQDGIVRNIEGTQTEPASPTQPSIAIESMSVHASSLPTESSLSESLQVPPTKRAYTSPSTITMKTLPPIIRNVNGRRHSSGKRKHVTFQLADRAIVEPSSSYEEGPSPDIDDDSIETKDSSDSLTSTSPTERNSAKANRPTAKRRNTPLDPFGRRKRTSIPQETPESEVGMSMGDLLLSSSQNDDHEPRASKHSSQQDEKDIGYFSPKHENYSPTTLSPGKSSGFDSIDDDAYITKRKEMLSNARQERRGSKSSSQSSQSPRRASFENMVEGSTAAGKKPSTQPYRSPHFSPSHSPITGAFQRHYPSTLEDEVFSTQNTIGVFELDEDLDSPHADTPQVHHDPDAQEDGDELEMTIGRKQRFQKVEDDIPMGTSVPIDIVRPNSYSMSNSWIGTFGH